MNRCNLQRFSLPLSRTSCALLASGECLRNLPQHHEGARRSPYLHRHRLPERATSPPSGETDRERLSVCASVPRVFPQRNEMPFAIAGLNAAAWARRISPFLFASPHPQISLHEGPQIPIQYAIHVADFELGAMVLDHPIGLEDVGTDLRSEADIELGVLDLLRDLPLLLHFEFVKL